MMAPSDRPVAFVAMGLAMALNVACGHSPGESCEKDSDCSSSLVCTFPQVEGTPAERGICTPKLAEEGAYCSANAWCASGLFCSNDLPSERSKPDGVCIPRLAERDRCFRDADCQPGLKCKRNADDILVCKAPAPDAASVYGGVLDAGVADGGIADGASVAPPD
jgi:hypothetical protein